MDGARASPGSANRSDTSPVGRARACSVTASRSTNKATCALANKLARICYATLRDGEPYGAARLTRKLTRTAFALPA